MINPSVVPLLPTQGGGTSCVAFRVPEFFASNSLYWSVLAGKIKLNRINVSQKSQ